MKVATDFRQAHALINEVAATHLVAPGVAKLTFATNPLVGIDIGKQFGTRIVIWLSGTTGHQLLDELEKRDLPLPIVIQEKGRVWIGAEPE